MLTVNPRDQKKLVQDIKSVVSPTDETVKFTQKNVATNQTNQVLKADYRQDIQLSPTEIESNKQYSVLPEEVGYISKYPVSGHVQAWIYITLIPIYTNLLIVFVNSNSTKGNYSIEATKQSLQDYRSYLPAISILAILFVIVSIYSKQFYMRYVGAAIAFIGFVGHAYLVYQSLELFLKNSSVAITSAISWELIFNGSFYPLVLSTILFFYSFLYFLLPKYRATYQ